MEINDLIFKDLKVLELASVLAGPSVGQFFGELGAEVIKVENLRTRGDVTRSWKTPSEKTDDLSAYFCSVNWAKKSIAVDLSQHEGQRIVTDLAIQSDLVIASFKPGDAEKLGVDYKTLSKLNPRIIYGEITGYGSQSDRVGYDAVIQAEAGFMDLNGEPGGLPLKMPVALVDVLASHHLKEGLLLSIIRRGQTGHGERVEVSLIQAAVASLVNQASNWLVANELPVRLGSSHPNIAPYGDSFETRDGKRILLAVGSDPQFLNLCDILSISDLASDTQFSTNQKRIQNRVVLTVRLGSAISSWNSDDLIRKLHGHKVPAGIIRNLKEVFETEEARKLLIQAGGLTGVTGFVANHEKHLHILPPPRFGEHTSEILTRLGISTESAAQLRLSKTVQ